MFGFHYFMWGTLALSLIVIGAFATGAIDIARMRAEERGQQEMMLRLPIETLSMLPVG